MYLVGDHSKCMSLPTFGAALRQQRTDEFATFLDIVHYVFRLVFFSFLFSFGLQCSGEQF